MNTRKRTHFVRNLLACLLAGTTALTTGCATLLGDTKQAVTIATNVKPAQVAVNGVPVVPGRLMLRRGTSYTVTAEARGYTGTSATIERRITPKWFILDALLVLACGAGAAALAVDFATGAMFELEPDALLLTLEPSNDSTDGAAR